MRSNYIFYTAWLMFILFVFSMHSHAQLENNLKHLGLVGKVKTLTETVFSFSVNENSEVITKGDMNEKDIYNFNDKGMLQLENVTIPTLSTFSKALYKYTNAWILTEKDQYDSTHEKGVVLTIKTTFTYNDKVKLLSQKSFDSDNKLFETTTYEYDDKGNITRSIYQDLSEKSIDTTSYDNKGKIMHEEVYNADGSLFAKDVYTYNEKGELTEKISYDHWSLDDKTYHTFNEKFTYLYDEHKNILEEDRFKSDETFLSKRVYKYEYDKVGNWIKLTSWKSENGKLLPDELKERVIEYY